MAIGSNPAWPPPKLITLAILPILTLEGNALACLTTVDRPIRVLDPEAQVVIVLVLALAMRVLHRAWAAQET
jgi:hypothetical protein